MKFKRVLIIILILLSTLFTGCWSSHEINTLAITVCIGIDRTPNGYLVSEQVINPKAIASKNSTNESPVVIYTAEGRDLAETIKSIVSQSPREIYNSHLRMVVLGSDTAEYGLKDIIDYFFRDREYRTDFYFVVARNATAKEVLSVLTPIESIPGIYMYNSLKLSSDNWAPDKDVRIVELTNAILADGKNPVIMGVEVLGGKVTPYSINELKQSSEIKKIKYTGLGAFKKDKLIGWLNEDESKGYNYITGEVKNTTEYTYSGDKIKISSQIKNVKSSIKADLINGKPVINVEIDIKQNIEEVEGNFDVSKEENKKKLNEMFEKRIKILCQEAVDKAQNELKTDIFGFGEAVHRQYPKEWEKIKSNWNNEFAHIPVNITVNVKTDQLGEITKPLFIKEKK